MYNNSSIKSTNIKVYKRINMINNKTNKFSNKEISRILRWIAAVYLLTNVNRFRIIAYEKAADTIEQLTREVKDIWQDGRLADVPGIGASIGAHLDEYFKTGKSKHFDSVLNKIPKTVFILMDIPTIGPKKAYKLVKGLNLINPKTVIADLERACYAKKVAKLDSFAEKSQADILEAIKLYRQKINKTERMPLPYAFALAKEIIEYLKKHELVKRVDALGSLRRMVATIGDIDIAIQVKSPNFATSFAKASKVKKASMGKEKLKVQSYKEIINYFLSYPKKIKVDNAGEKKASLIVHPNIRVDLRVQDEKSYGSMLQYFSGNKAHNIKLREYALKKGLSLSEYGIKNIKKISEFSNEEKLYNFLGLQFIPPEIREGTDEIEVAANKKIPKLVEVKEIKGDLHIHSSYDLQPSHDLGNNSYREILAYAERVGYQYIGFADHNPKITDLNEAEIIEIMKARKSEINKIRNQQSQVKCFIGLEVDILSDGRIALPKEAIDYVDYLIVSVHSVFGQDMKSMTERVLKALKYPKVKILGHPTGRLLSKREGYELDWQKIFSYCSRHNIALEINSWPERLDLPDLLVREGLNYGVKFIINTDAHSNPQMDGIFYGVSVARRVWCEENDIINTLIFEKFQKWLRG